MLTLINNFYEFYQVGRLESDFFSLEIPSVLIDISNDGGMN